MTLTKEWVEKEISVCRRSNCVGDYECEWCALCRFWLAHQWQPIETAPNNTRINALAAPPRSAEGNAMTPSSDNRSPEFTAEDYEGAAQAHFRDATTSNMLRAAADLARECERLRFNLKVWEDGTWAHADEKDYWQEKALAAESREAELREKVRVLREAFKGMPCECVDITGICAGKIICERCRALAATADEPKG